MRYQVWPLAFCFCAVLVTQPPRNPTWVPLSVSTEEGLNLAYTISNLGDGLGVLVHNGGAVDVHFGYHLPGYQTEADAPANGRIHIKPGRSLSLHSLTPFQGVKVVSVCVGPRDGGICVQ